MTLDFLFKILLMIAAAGGLYLLARGWTPTGPDPDRREEVLPPPPPLAPRLEIRDLDSMPRSPVTGAPDATYAPVPRNSEFERHMIIEQHSFATFDPIPGPPDPACFCDELIVRVFYRDTGYTGTRHFTVATPAGIRSTLEDSDNDCLILDLTTLIVDHYDHDLIMRAVIDEILEHYDVSKEIERDAAIERGEVL